MATSLAMHPAFASMVQAADGVLTAHHRDLEYHDRLTTRALDRRECFVWIVGSSATHIVREVADVEARNAYHRAFHPITGSCRSKANAVYFWNGRTFEPMLHNAAFDALAQAADARERMH